MEGSPPAGRPGPVTPGPSGSNPSPCRRGTPHQHLSASLKARLQRSRRSFATPSSSSVAKRLCVDEHDDDRDQKSDGRQVAADPEDVAPKPLGDGQHVVQNKTQVVESETGEGLPESGPACVLTLRERLRRELRDKMEDLRRLNMVKVYRSKNDLTHLQTLISKWRGCSQAALYALQTDGPADGQKASLSQLIDLFGLEDQILHFDRVEEDFTD